MSAAIETIFDELRESAAKAGAEVELTLSQGENFSATYKQQALHKYSFHESQSAHLRVLFEKAEGFYSTEKVSRDSLKAGLETALASAKELNKSKKPTDLKRELKGPSTVRELEGLYVPNAMLMPVEERLQKARDLEGVALAADARVKSVPYSGFSLGQGGARVWNSRGLKLETQQTMTSGYCYPMAEQNGDTKMLAHSAFCREPFAFKADRIAREAVRQSTSLLGAQPIASKKWTVVFSNQVVAKFLGLLIGDFSAKSVDEGISLLKNRRGDKVFSDLFTVTDDPFVAELPGARAFDAEGYPTQKTVVVRNGVLENYLTDSLYARKMQLPHTASAVRGSGEIDVGSSNWLVTPGKDSLESMFNSALDMVYIVSVDALHSGYKSGTGDFSLPGKGFHVRSGEIVSPVDQFVVSGNVLDIFGRASMISNKLNDDANSVRSPDMLVEGISIAGK